MTSETFLIMHSVIMKVRACLCVKCDSLDVQEQFWPDATSDSHGWPWDLNPGFCCESQWLLLVKHIENKW